MEILLFGVTKDIIGQDRLALDAEEQEGIGNVAQLRALLLDKYPRLQDLASLALAVNNAYAEPEQPVGSTDEIALIPPVSGG